MTTETLVHNERLKLLASGLNNLGVAAIVTGFIAPAVSQLYGTAPVAGTWRGIMLFAIWVSLGALLMGYARNVLGGLKE